jgi:phosphoenolpyruvate phosphomutase
MKALILNSGLGKRMGDITKEHPKCMTEITEEDTILSRQLKQLADCGITEVVMTTGPFEDKLIEYCKSLNLPIKIDFVNNPIYKDTNYIYSMYLARELLDDDIVMMHGDLVFDKDVLEEILERKESSMTVSSTLPLPEKDFKSVIKNGEIKKVGIEFFEDAMASQPLYKFNKEDFAKWMKAIEIFCERGMTNCYAENALNVITDDLILTPMDVQDRLCNEIDNLNDLETIKERLKKNEINKKFLKK